MHKRGQFYLFAAIVIIIILFGLFSIRNFAKVAPEDTTVADLKKELNIETGKVVDFAIYNRDSVDDMIANWTDLYVREKSAQEIENFIFAYGNKTVLNIITFKNSTGSTSITYGGVTFSLSNIDEYKYQKKFTFPTEVNNITLSIDNINYDFDLASQQNFIFLIKKGGYFESGTTG